MANQMSVTGREFEAWKCLCGINQYTPRVSILAETLTSHTCARNTLVIGSYVRSATERVWLRMVAETRQDASAARNDRRVHSA